MTSPVYWDVSIIDWLFIWYWQSVKESDIGLDWRENCERNLQIPPSSCFQSKIFKIRVGVEFETLGKYLCICNLSNVWLTKNLIYKCEMFRNLYVFHTRWTEFTFNVWLCETIFLNAFISKTNRHSDIDQKPGKQIRSRINRCPYKSIYWTLSLTIFYRRNNLEVIFFLLRKVELCIFLC